MIRIAFLAPFLATGGTQRHLQQVVRFLDRRRFAAEVLTLSAGGEIEAELRADGVPVTSLSVGPRLTSARAARSILQAARQLRAGGVHVVHGYSGDRRSSARSSRDSPASRSSSRASGASRATTDARASHGG